MSRYILFACLQLLCLQHVFSQAIFPKCGCQSQCTVTETCVNPLVVNQPCQLAPVCQQVVAPCQQMVAQCQQVVAPCQQMVAPCQQMVAPCQQLVAQNYACQRCQAAFPAVNVVNPCEVDYVASYGVPTTTIIQEDSIANELANTLQLLIVSNLLGNTLPNNDLYAPALVGQPLLGSSVASLAVPALVGCGCGCGCGCGGSCGCGCGGCGCGCGGCGCGCGGCNYIF